MSGIKGSVNTDGSFIHSLYCLYQLITCIPDIQKHTERESLTGDAKEENPNFTKPKVIKTSQTSH